MIGARRGIEPRRPCAVGIRLRWCALLFAPAVLVACTIITEFSSDRVIEQTEERCSDRLDNDGNGVADCADPTCKRFEFCDEATEARCSDSLDNDADGLADCNDSGCCDFAHCSSEPGCGERSVAACTDGRDNDWNGLTDCADFSCTTGACCQRLLPLLVERFLAGAQGCAPPDCAVLQESCCTKSGSDVAPCNAFDPARWQAWGNPAPRLISSQAFTPNQPCLDCAASGLVSLPDFAFAPDLVLEFEADARDDAAAFLAAGFVDQAIVRLSSAPCAGLLEAEPYAMLAGLNLRGAQVEAVLGGIKRSSVPLKPGGAHRLRLAFNRRGPSLSYSVDDRVFFEAPMKIEAAPRRVRVLLQGHTAVGTIDDVLVATQSGCLDAGRWVSGPGGPGPVLGPGRADRFDGTAISGPSVLANGSTLHLYYTGSSANGETRLGVASSSDGGLTFTPPKSPLGISGELAENLSNPVVIRHGDGLLMAYTRLRTDGGSSIGIATSAEVGAGWTARGVALEGAAGSWDAEVDAPALVLFRNRLHLDYVGRGKGSLPALGLATAGDPLVFAREPGSPLLRPGVSTHDDRGIADPWVMARSDGSLELWYVGLTWGGQTQINLCASNDGRNWVRFPANPTLRAGEPGLFGGAAVRGPTILDRWGTLHLWYAGSDPAVPSSIGYAQSDARAP